MPPRQIGDEYPLCPQATESGGITLVFFSLDQYSPCSRCHVNLHSKVPHRHATEANWGRISFMSPSDRIGGNYSRVFLLRSVFPLLPMPCKFAFKGPPSTCHRGKLGTISFMSPSDRIGGNYSRVFLLRSVFPLLPMPCKFAFKGPPSTCHRGKLGTNILYVPKRHATESGGITLVFFSLDQYSPCSRCHVNLHSKVPHRHATEANWGRISFMSPSDRIGGNYSRVFLLRSVFPLLPMPCKFAFKGPPSTCHRGKLGTNILYVPKRQNRGELLSCFSP